MDLATYLESIGNTSPVTASVSERAGKSVRPFQLRPPNNTVVNIRNSISLLLGYTNAAVTNDGRLNRQCPPEDPLYPYWYVSGIDRITGIGDPQMKATSLPPVANTPETMPFFTSYDTTEFSVGFAPRTYQVLTDTAITGSNPIQWFPHRSPFTANIKDINVPPVQSIYANEWLRYVDFGLAPQNDNITAVAGQSYFQTSSGAIPNGAVFQGMPRIFLPNQIFKIIWHQVPLRFWTSANSYLRRWVGHVNYFPWFDWPTVPGGQPSKMFDAASLLFLGATPVIYTSTAAQFLDNGQGDFASWKFCDFEMTFLVTQRTPTDTPTPANKNYMALGHNLQAYFPTRNFYYVTFGNGVIYNGTTHGDFTLDGLSNATKTLTAGMAINGAGISPGTTISSVDSDTSITMSNTAAASATGPYTFTDNANAVPYWFAFPFELLFTDPDTPQPGPQPVPG